MPTDADPVAYCGLPPLPAEIWTKWNLDPVLITALVLVGCSYAWGWWSLRARGDFILERREAVLFLAGWLIATLALVSPLCRLSVALFSARVGQHMILTLIAAPLVVLGRPEAAFRALATRLAPRLGRSCIARALRPPANPLVAWTAFAAFLWFWHAPTPYAATFKSDIVYWTMHLTLFGSALLLWRSLLAAGEKGQVVAIASGFTTSIHMGLLGALLTFAPRPLFARHAATTWPWGLSPLADQQLGGLIMWVPGCSIFVIAGLIAGAALLRSLDERHAAPPMTEA
ncbi:MAG TPA: cytochrome c oxidase assembly protein [Geminicoccaceae bacterium]|nr:cytochrome c oxidase assembly protein [Geminicoccaceae bacterium]